MNLFTHVPAPKVRKNTFDLSHEVKLTMKFGKLVPFICQEVLPGDKWRLNTEMLVRLAPLMSPIMQRINVYTHFFFVPNRLVFDRWDDFITGGEDGYAKVAFPRILLKPDERQTSGLADYLGVPTYDKKNRSFGFYVSSLPFKAYQLIYNEYYRDQNQEPEIDIFKEQEGDLSDTLKIRELTTLRTRCWFKDYFTSALPWAQRGEQAKLPLAGNVPIELNKAGHHFQTLVSSKDGRSFTVNNSNQLEDVFLSSKDGSLQVPSTMGDPMDHANLDPNGTLIGNLNKSAEITINELRRSFALQRWLERNMRGGARYCEQLLSHFGVKIQDERLQRPEYLGGGKSPVQISEVLQTSQSVEGKFQTPQGTMAGHGVSASSNHGFTHYFPEHGYIIGIMSIMPYGTYMDGIPRHFLKDDKFDWAWPEFAHLGEQEIWDSELYLTQPSHEAQLKLGSNNLSKELFGYTPRYSEYRFGLGSVHGDFRSSLKFWHQARSFDSAPALNADFLRCDDSRLDDVFAVTEDDTDKLWVQIYNNIRAIRPLPKYAEPI